VIVRDVEESSTAADQGIEAGDVVLEVNGTPITDRAAFQSAMRQAEASRRPARLLVGRVSEDGRLSTRFVALRFAPR
jgi:serine protease Do